MIFYLLHMWSYCGQFQLRVQLLDPLDRIKPSKRHEDWSSFKFQNRSSTSLTQKLAMVKLRFCFYFMKQSYGTTTQFYQTQCVSLLRAHERSAHLVEHLACACDQSHNQKVHKHVFSTLVDPNEDIGFELVFFGSQGGKIMISFPVTPIYDLQWFVWTFTF